MRIGEVLEGTYTRLLDKKNYMPSHLILVEGSIIKLYGVRVLNRMLAQTTPGDDVRIEVLEERTSEEGYPYKVFDVRSNFKSIEEMLSELEWENVIKGMHSLYRVNEIGLDCIFCCGKRTMSLYNDSKIFYCHKCEERGDILNWLEHTANGLKSLRELTSNK